jgi:isocitrate/isopropylmalate dehydrogenase
MMLEWLGETGRAERIAHAVETVVARGEVRTYDMGGTATTMEMAQAVCAELAT